MRFGALPLAEALGGIVVHTVRAGGVVVKKGTVLGEREIAALREAGQSTITVAMLEPEDVGEDAAAGEIAQALAGPGLRAERAFTGRANLFAAHPGLLLVDRAGVDRLNAIDPDVTFATLAEYAPVEAGTMAATVKIIPFAIRGEVRDAAVAAGRATPLVRIAPYRVRRVAVVSTILPGLADKVIDKTVRITAERLAPAGAAIVAERRVAHDVATLAGVLEEVVAEAELVVVFGASAIADRRDVVPAAIEAVGGRIERIGMPVDPGNLLLLAEVRGRPVLGAPGCARSPKENGFDWVLARLLCGLPVTHEDIARMGTGGLLMEIVTRPQPRAGEPPEGHRIAALVLAAGRSTRMGGPNKLLAEIGGAPLVRIAAAEALGSRADPVIVVTGHQRDEVAAALAGLQVTLVHNPDYAEGLSTSLRAGVAALGPEVDGTIVCLGDMPQVDRATIDRLIAAFDPDHGALIVVPTVAGKRGNPVVWSRRFFGDLTKLSGDTGARHLIATYRDVVVEVALEGEGALTDVDTPEALAAARVAREGG